MSSDTQVDSKASFGSSSSSVSSTTSGSSTSSSSTSCTNSSSSDSTSEVKNSEKSSEKGTKSNSDEDDEVKVSDQDRESYKSDVPDADNVEDSSARSRFSTSSSSDTEILDSSKNKTPLHQIQGRNLARLLPTKLQRKMKTWRNVPTQSLYYGVFTVYQRHNGNCHKLPYSSYKPVILEKD
jgi:hypothetical protein